MKILPIALRLLAPFALVGAMTACDVDVDTNDDDDDVGEGEGEGEDIDFTSDCEAVCQRYSECYDETFDVDSCTSECVDESDSEAFRDDVETCENCMDDESCLSATFVCNGECAGVIDESTE